MAEQAKAGHVSGAASADVERRAAGLRVQLTHRVRESLELPGPQVAVLCRRRQQGSSDRFREQQSVAWLRCSIGEQLSWIGPSGHGQAVLQLLVDDRVTADDERTGLVHLLLSTAKDLPKHLERELARREADDVERGHRLATHGVDV